MTSGGKDGASDTDWIKREKRRTSRGLGVRSPAEAFTRFLTCPMAWDRPLHSLALSGFTSAGLKNSNLPARPESEPTMRGGMLRPPVLAQAPGAPALPSLSLSLAKDGFFSC